MMSKLGELENFGGYVKVGTNDPILSVVPYTPERPPKWMFWRSTKQYLAVLTKSQKLYIADFTNGRPEITSKSGDK